MVPSLLLRRGRVIDPTTSLDTVADVLVVDGVIAAVGPDLISAGLPVVDVTGLLVVPGLIDLHTHVMAGLGDFCVEPDRIGVSMGVPTVVDGGTSGVATFDICRRAIIDDPTVRTRVLAFMDPNQLYLATGDFICHKLEIANDLRNLDVGALEASLARHADVIVGLKARACHTGDPTFSPFLDAAQRAAGAKPVMVHLGRFPHTPVITPPSLLAALRPGDIVTHAFRGAGGLLGADGKAIPAFRDAVDRGVVLDMGHSGTDFRFREARRLLDQGYRPETASTDLNVFNIDGPVFSYLENLTKLLALGLDLVDVVAIATSNAARAIGRQELLGSLALGRPAEISVLALHTDGPYPGQRRPRGRRRPRRPLPCRLRPGRGLDRGHPAAQLRFGRAYLGRGARRHRLVTAAEPAGLVQDDLSRLLACFWHPVCTIAELAATTSGVLAVRLLGRDLAVARVAGGSPIALLDRCLHRSTRLSIGWVDGDAIRCAYHGWRWAADGRCVEIPSAPGTPIPGRFCQEAFDAAEHYGLVWVRLDSRYPTTVPAMPATDDPTMHIVAGEPYTWPTAAPRRVENFVDLAHFAWVHDGTLGRRDEPVPPVPVLSRVGGELRFHFDPPPLEDQPATALVGASHYRLPDPSDRRHRVRDRRTSRRAPSSLDDGVAHRRRDQPDVLDPRPQRRPR